MKIVSAELETVCGITSRLPENDMPEIAFAGKSNVGKSSLINALMNRKALARTSSRPGKTQTINFYRINRGVKEEEIAGRDFAPEMYLVDLPGYGYAGVPLEEKAKWGPMIERYLHGSRMLRAVFLLIDLRHDPGKNDIMMYRWIRENGFSPIIIATKADKLKKAAVKKNLASLRRSLGMPGDVPAIPFSAVTKQGLDEIYALMRRAARPEEPQPEGGGAEAGLRRDMPSESAHSETGQQDASKREAMRPAGTQSEGKPSGGKPSGGKPSEGKATEGGRP